VSQIGGDLKKLELDIQAAIRRLDDLIFDEQERIKLLRMIEQAKGNFRTNFVGLEKSQEAIEQLLQVLTRLLQVMSSGIEDELGRPSDYTDMAEKIVEFQARVSEVQMSYESLSVHLKGLVQQFERAVTETNKPSTKL